MEVWLYQRAMTVMKKGGKTTRRLNLETKPVTIPPSARNMVFSNAIAASNDSTARLTAQGAPL